MGAPINAYATVEEPTRANTISVEGGPARYPGSERGVQGHDFGPPVRGNAQLQHALVYGDLATAYGRRCCGERQFICVTRRFENPAGGSDPAGDLLQAAAAEVVAITRRGRVSSMPRRLLQIGSAIPGTGPG